MGYVTDLKDGFRAFTPQERRNIAFYIAGIMIYKFGLEAFNGSVVALATNRYDYESILNNKPSRTFERVGLLTGLNQAFQCIGSILIGPLVKRYPTKNVLAVAILVFGLCSALLLIIDAATGGTFMPVAYRTNHPENEWSYYGKYNTDAMIPVYCVSGIAYGMVELIRRVIPRDIVGGHIQKLRKMDSIVHIFYEITGTGGAFITALVIIPQLGNNMAFIVTPICFTFSAIIWFFISELDFKRHKPSTLNQRDKPAYWKAAFHGLYLFGESIWVGAKILCSSRKFIWLVPGYAVALYAHRYLENGIAPQIARRYLGHSAWSQIMVGGSNLGELLGALCVLLLTNKIQTPMPWLRLDALMLLIVWYVPFWRPVSGDVGQAWIVAGTFAPISFGWAAGDVSLAAYIQASLARLESKNKNVSALGAVMAFLYSFYIVTYAISGTLLGRYLDGVYNKSGGNSEGGEIHDGLLFTAGLQMTIISVLVLAATFVPKGALAFNPKMISDENLNGDDVGMDGRAKQEDQGQQKGVHVRSSVSVVVERSNKSYCSDEGSEPNVEKRVSEIL
ncbi:major facilitator superfamily domain-containing protein [Podospora australis]|uniref:Major facilitator superfamily domain-containing protein n=1 Tax=Podospora australis TaxID=1536484 RepID=A0AAN6WLU2_9PEZI|nr:major facilitator superfamily domain-containing protein [Podospora australis]